MRERITTVKMGDEIEIDAILNDTQFHAWCQQSKIDFKDLGCGSWSQCPYLTSSFVVNASTTLPKLFYWSQKAGHETGIAMVKRTVDRLRPLVPNALLGANWAPTARYKGTDGTGRVHHYVGWTFQYIVSASPRAHMLPLMILMVIDPHTDAKLAAR